MTSGKELPTTEVKEILEKVGYIYINSYIGKWNKTRVIVLDNSDYKYDVYLKDLIRGNEVRFVDKRNPFTLENIYKWCILENKPFILCENNVYKGALEKMFFQCLKGDCAEVFKQNWNVIYNGGGCSNCSKLNVKKPGSLKLKLVEEWNYELNDILPKDVNSGSEGQYYWICKKCKYGSNGEWLVKILSRSRGSGCPACSGLVVSDRNRLSILYPEIASEWHPVKNNGLTAENVSYGSGKKVWWLCPNGHEYFSKINGSQNGKGCRICADFQKESRIATELKLYILNKYNSEDEYRIVKNPDTGVWLWYDIYIFGGENKFINGIYIEIHGGQHYRFIQFWHKTEEKFKYNKRLDKIKKNFAKKNGTYIEIDLRKIKCVEEAIQYINEKVT